MGRSVADGGSPFRLLGDSGPVIRLWRLALERAIWLYDFQGIFERMVSRLPLMRLRAICMSLPDTTEVISHGEPTFRAHKRMFATYANSATHHGKGRDAVWCKATLVTQGILVSQQPDRIFVPAYVGHQGWIGIWLDHDVDWRMVRELLEGAHHLVTPVRKRVPRAEK